MAGSVYSIHGSESQSDDEDLKRAIALSLQGDANEGPCLMDTAQPAPEDQVDAEALKQAMSLSLQHAEESKRKTDNSKQMGGTQHADQVSKQPPVARSHGIPGLDRAAMEKERLARMTLKRKAEHADNDDACGDTGKGSISPPPTKRTQTQAPPPMARIGIRENAHSQTSQQSNKPPTSPSADDSKPQFLRGRVFKTYSRSHPRTSADIKIDEVLRASHLKLAVLSAFQWDLAWLLPKIQRPATKLVMVMQAKDEGTRQQYLAETAGQPGLRLCFPPMPGNVNCMHSKLMLLGYEDHLRIAIPTANLTAYDWGETDGGMENSVFVIDLPRREGGGKCNEEELGIFGRELVRFCQAVTLDERIIDSLAEFDFSGAQGLAFVHSIGGEQTGKFDDADAAWHDTGLPRLGRAVRELGLQTSEELEIDFVASSIGSLNEDFLASIYLACQGEDTSQELSWRSNAANITQHADQKSKGLTRGRAKPADVDTSGRDRLIADVKQNFRLFFPSRETVMASIGGPNNAGTVCFQEKWYQNPKFPKQIMRDCQSIRSGLLMHNKVSLAPLNLDIKRK